jgi:hypothetical protein
MLVGPLLDLHFALFQTTLNLYSDHYFLANTPAMFSTPLYNTKYDLIDDALLVVLLQSLQEVDKPRQRRRLRREEGQ